MPNNKKITKKIIKAGLGIITFLGLSLASFGGNGATNNTASAANPEAQFVDLYKEEGTTNNTAKTNFFGLLDIILKIIYIMVWPLLFLAGLSLDNSMVYGSFLNMDAPLWQFWNMAKNFANFALGFMLLVGILKSIFSFGGAGSFDKKDTPLGIIKKALIAGILIQASRFLTAALIDVSTIATYAIGGMPISVMKTVPQFNDKKILLTNSSLDLNSIDKIQEEPFKNSYIVNTKEGKKINISQCKTSNNGGDLFIIGRVDGSTGYKNDGIVNDKEKGMPTRNLCVYANKVYIFNEFPNTRNAENIAEYNTEYNDKLLTIIALLTSSPKGIDAMVNCRFIINLSNPTTSFTKSCTESLKEAYTTIDADTKRMAITNTEYSWMDGVSNIDLLPKTDDATFISEYGNTKGEKWFGENATNTMGNIIDKAQGFVGPLVAIYASLMDFANIADTAQNEGSISKGIGELLIRTGVALGLVFPLLALAIVLIARIGFLWMVIAASPLIILNKVFELDFLKETIGIENIVKTIFAPVITVFALSISLIFMTALSDGFKPIDGKGGTLAQEQSQQQIIDNFKGMNIDVIPGAEGDKTTTIEIFGQQITYPKIYSTYAGATGDRFSWMIVSLCGIGIMRFILFAAIKATGTIGKKVGQAVQDFGQNVFKTMPIVPAMGGMSISNIIEGANIPDKVLTKYQNSQQQDFSERMESKFGALAKDSNTPDDSMNKYEAADMFKAIQSGDPLQIKALQEKGNFTEGILLDPTVNKHFEDIMKGEIEKGNMTPEQASEYRKGFEEKLNNATAGARAKDLAQKAFKVIDIKDSNNTTVKELNDLIAKDETKKLVEVDKDYFNNLTYTVKEANGVTSKYKITNTNGELKTEIIPETPTTK